VTKEERNKLNEIVFLLKKNWKQYEEGAKNLPDVPENVGRRMYLKGHADGYLGVWQKLRQEGLAE
jgi:hypothetical protein